VGEEHHRAAGPGSENPVPANAGALTVESRVHEGLCGDLAGRKDFATACCKIALGHTYGFSTDLVKVPEERLWYIQAAIENS